MSRGLGKVERGVLATLAAAGEPLRAIDIAVAVYAIPPGEDGWCDVDAAQWAAVRRAVLSLKRKGLIARAGRNRFGVLWALPEAAKAAKARAEVRAGLAMMIATRGPDHPLVQSILARMKADDEAEADHGEGEGEP